MLRGRRGKGRVCSRRMEAQGMWHPGPHSPSWASLEAVGTAVMRWPPARSAHGARPWGPERSGRGLPSTDRQQGVHCVSKSRRQEAREGPRSRAESRLPACSLPSPGRRGCTTEDPAPSPPASRLREASQGPAWALSQQPPPPPAAGILSEAPQHFSWEIC